MDGSSTDTVLIPDVELPRCKLLYLLLFLFVLGLSQYISVGGSHGVGGCGPWSKGHVLDKSDR